jgi:signal peptidase I
MKNQKKIILDILIILLSALVLLQVFFPNVSMKITGIRNYVVISDSMDPKIKVNDMVVVRNMNASKLKAGDIITFYAYLPTIHQDSLGNTIYKRFVITHYLGEVIEINDETIFKTYGVKNNPDLSYDQWKDENGLDTEIQEEDMIGKVVLIVPKVGVISTIMFNVLRNPVFLVLILVNIGIIYAIYVMIKRYKKEKNHGVE